MNFDRIAEIILIPLSNIDSNDQTFSFSPPWITAPCLLESVRRVGVRVPLRVQRREGGRFRIVSGFQRFRAAVANEIETLACVVVEQKTETELFIEVIHENLGTRKLQDIEKALALLRLRDRFSMGEGELIGEFLPILGIRPDRFNLRRYLQLARLPENLQQALTDVQMQVVLAISSWSEADQVLFVELVRKYRMGRNRQHQCFVLLDELRAARKLEGAAGGLPTIWADSGAREIDENGRLSPADRLEGIMRSLRSMRYPMLARHEECFRQLKARLRIPDQIQFNPPRFFEGDQITLQFSIRNAKELRDLAGRLLEVSGKKSLRAIFELL